MKHFFDYMKEATVAVCTVEATKKRFCQAGFLELDFHGNWQVKAGGAYFVQSSPSMLMAFKLAAVDQIEHLKIIGAHTDNPALKIKPSPEVNSEGYRRLNIEIYGGPIFSTWFDRPLGIAGTVALRSENPLKPEIRILDFKKSLLTIPNLAIHMNREVNKGVEIKAQKEMLPLISTFHEQMEKQNYLLGLIAKELKVETENILDFDLFVYCNEEGQLVGAEEEFISCPRIDDTAMVYAGMQALIEAQPKTGINIAFFVDHEEIGSLSRQGAHSVILNWHLEKLRSALKMEALAWQDCLANSFFVSADGAHALHPAFPEKCDPTNHPKVNEGIVIKISGNKAYATEAISSSVWQQICEKAGVKSQKFANHADIRGGTTIGSIVSSYLPIQIVDTGLAMLAMHSTRELAGKKDLQDMIKAMTSFYEL